MTTIASDVAELLAGVHRAGGFCTSGTCEMYPPGLDVAGVGAIALPLMPAQADSLVAVAERAPYGRGQETLVDTEVRRTWQIDANRVRLHGRHWAQTLDSIVARVAEGLGVTGTVTAELYKLLVYDEGGFFVSHRDTEKADRMFATLVIVLPSLYSGGDLVVRHQDREVRLDLRSTDPAEAAFAAFYADCLHEVLPVTSGCRLTLIYNLLLRSADGQPQPPSYEAEQDRLAALLEQWPEGAPEKLIYPLEHAYTPAGLSFDALKGVDAARAAVVRAAAQEADCDLHLALLSLQESGSAEYTGDHYSYGRRYHKDEDDEDEEDDFEVIEVIDSSVTLSDWRQADGEDAGLGVLPVEEDELSPPDALEDITPTEQSFHEATGNEGASFERTYRLAALVFWPKDRRLAVVNQGGLPASLPYLADLTGRWAASDDDNRPSLWAEAHALSDQMLASWPKEPRRSTQSPSDAATMLMLLGRLGDTDRIDAFLAEVSAAGVYGMDDTVPMVQAVALLPPSRAADLLQAVVVANAAAALNACANLLARAVTMLTAVDLRPAAAALVAALPGDPARAAPVSPWSRPRPMAPSTIVDLVSGLDGIAPVLANAAVDTVLAWPRTYDADAVLVPAAMALDSSARRDAAAVVRLHDASLAHLRGRIAAPLAPPSDWTRDNSTVSCRCPHCTALATFLTDPAHETWMFKAVQADRSHVESTIRNSTCDLDTETLRRGSPHTLVCTKNQASYQRRVLQRKKDLEDVARLERRGGAS